MAQQMSVSSPRVTGLNVFPIKSCRAVQVRELEVDSCGVVGDRRFMLVDGNGRFLSQRKFAKFATVTARIVEEDGKKVLIASSPYMGRQLRVEVVSDGPRVECSIWESKVMAVDQGDEAAAWFSELTGVGSTFHRLVGSAESSGGFHRVVGNIPLSLKGRLPPMKIALADEGPVSLLSQESLEDLNRRLRERTGEVVAMDRFRMNIEVCGCEQAFEEDQWLLVRIGTVPFLAYANAERCKMTAINQDTGETDKLGPLEILRTYRAPRGPTHALFGQLLLPLQSGGKVQVGDTVEVMERKKPSV